MTLKNKIAEEKKSETAEEKRTRGTESEAENIIQTHILCLFDSSVVLFFAPFVVFILQTNVLYVGFLLHNFTCSFNKKNGQAVFL